MAYDMKSFASSLLKKRAKKAAKSKSKKSGSGQKSNAWRAYVSGGKKR